MSRSRDYLKQIALTLERYEVVPLVTEEMIEYGCKKLRETPGLTSVDGVFVVLEAWLPERCVRFGSGIASTEDAAYLLRKLAQATGGEWKLADVSSTLVSETEEGRMEAIDFVSQGKPMRWQHTVSLPDGTPTRWGEAFVFWLMEFLGTTLSGMFWGPLLGTQTLLMCYLPEPAAMDLMMIQQAIEEDFGELDFEDGFRAFVDTL